MGKGVLFNPGFLLVLKSFVDVHHSIYPTVPPQGIYFEALVERTFRAIHKPFAIITPGGTWHRYEKRFHQHYQAVHYRTRALGRPNA